MTTTQSSPMPLFAFVGYDRDGTIAKNLFVTETESATGWEFEMSYGASIPFVQNDPCAASEDWSEENVWLTTDKVFPSLEEAIYELIGQLRWKVEENIRPGCSFLYQVHNFRPVGQPS